MILRCVIMDVISAVRWDGTCPILFVNIFLSFSFTFHYVSLFKNQNSAQFGSLLSKHSSYCRGNTQLRRMKVVAFTAEELISIPNKRFI